jgi:hypothetical protein
MKIRRESFHFREILGAFYLAECPGTTCSRVGDEKSHVECERSHG